MSLYLLVHKTDKRDASSASGQLIQDLIKHDMEDLVSIYFSGTLIRIESDINIEFRCGDTPDKMAGLRPDFWYSDNHIIAEMIELGACKCGGQRLSDISQVVPIIKEYLEFKKRVKC